jgi:hypothetical protein
VARGRRSGGRSNLRGVPENCAGKLSGLKVGGRSTSAAIAGVASFPPVEATVGSIQKIVRSFGSRRLEERESGDTRPVLLDVIRSLTHHSGYVGNHAVAEILFSAIGKGRCLRFIAPLMHGFCRRQIAEPAVQQAEVKSKGEP